MFDTAIGGDQICSATQAAELPQNATARPAGLGSTKRRIGGHADHARPSVLTTLRRDKVGALIAVIGRTDESPSVPATPIN
jgi:hypothetical protein